MPLISDSGTSLEQRLREAGASHIDCDCLLCEAADALAAHVAARSTEWRCFHCDEVFTVQFPDEVLERALAAIHHAVDVENSIDCGRLRSYYSAGPREHAVDDLNSIDCGTEDMVEA